MDATITIQTTVTNERPTNTGVADGVDYDADVAVTDEAGETYRWRGTLTYAPDPGRGGELRPYGDTLDTWMSSGLIRCLETPWIAAHRSIVRAIRRSLAGGKGVETIEVEV